ncbi:Vitamin B12 import ATP-binding protein BtuD [Streptomyces violarus]
MGPSGSGKSTLMHCLAGLDTVTGGQMYIDETEITGLKGEKLTQLRRDRIGFIFQAFNLLPTLNAIENITLPMDIAGRKPDKQWLTRVVETVGLADRLKHRPTQLSGGQQQRVAVARALAAQPEIIFEHRPRKPRLARRRRGARLPAPVRGQAGPDHRDGHPRPGHASYTDRVLYLADGRIVDEMFELTAEAVLEHEDLGAREVRQGPRRQPDYKIKVAFKDGATADLTVRAITSSDVVIDAGAMYTSITTMASTSPPTRCRWT